VSQAIEIDIIADLTCPWSYIGKKRLEATLELLGVEARTRWYPYMQEPEIPPGGIARSEWLARAYGVPEQVSKALEPIRVAGMQDGVEFDFDAIKVMPNTLDAHRMVRWAREAGREDEMVERLYAMFFREGKDIGDHDVLAGAAEEMGLMNRFKARKMLESELDVEEIWQEMKQAHELGLKVVPAYIIAGKYAILGVEDPVTMAQAIQKAVSGEAPDAGPEKAEEEGKGE